jgi:transketolase
VVLALTRQKVPVLDREKLAPAEGVRRGAYVLADPPQAAPEVILVATGSEVHLERAVAARVVSMPSWEIFEAQPREYRESVLPPAIRARVAVEAGSSFAWLRYVTEAGEVMGIDRFGASAPGEVLFREFGFTVERVLESVDRVLGNTRGP